MKNKSLLTATALLTFCTSNAFANLLTAETSFNVEQLPMCVPQGNIKFDFGAIDSKVANTSPDQIRDAKSHAELVLTNCSAETKVSLKSPGTFTTPSSSGAMVATFITPAEASGDAESPQIIMTKASFGVQLLANADIASSADVTDKSKHILEAEGAELVLTQQNRISLFATLHHTEEFIKFKEDLAYFAAGNYKLNIPVTIELK